MWTIFGVSKHGQKLPNLKIVKMTILNFSLLKVQPLIEKLEEIFGDFKESGVSLIDQEVEDVEAVGPENDDNEGG